MKICGFILRFLVRFKLREQIWLFIDQVIWSGSSFLIGILIARLLSPEALTHYSIILACLFFITSGQQSLIFSFIYSRAFTLSKYRLARALNMQIILFSAVGVLFPIILTILHVTKIVSTSSAIIIFFFLISLIMYEYYRKMFIYLRQYRVLLQSDIIVKFVPLTIILLFAPKTLNEVIITISATTILYLFWLLKLFPVQWRQISGYLTVGRNINSMFNFGKWLLLGNFLQWTSGYLVLFGATIIIGAKEVGYVIAIKNLLGVSTLVFQFYESYVTPRFRCKYNLTEDFVQLTKLSAISFIILCLFLIVVWKFAEPIVFFVLGSKYTVYSAYVYPLTVLVMLEFFQRPVLVLLRAYDKTKIVFFAYVATTFLACLTIYPVVFNFEGVGMISILVALQCLLIIFYVSKALAIYKKKIKT